MGRFRALLERSWDDHDRSWDSLDNFGPPMGRFWALRQSILSIRSSILGSQRIDFAVSARYDCDSASNIEFRMICFRFSLELLHETLNVKAHIRLCPLQRGGTCAAHGIFVRRCARPSRRPSWMLLHRFFDELAPKFATNLPRGRISVATML